MNEPIQAELHHWSETHCYHCRKELPRLALDAGDLRSCVECFDRLNLDGSPSPVEPHALLLGGYPASKGTHAQAEQKARLRLVHGLSDQQNL